MNGEGPQAGLVIVYTLYGDLDAAEAAAGAMVQARLAACANILSPSRSCFLWNGVYEMQTEYPVLFKTGVDQREALMTRLGQDHPYEIPAILSWDANAAPSYAAWVGDMTGAS